MRKQRETREIYLVLLLTIFGVFLFLLLSAMWIHHLQPLSVVALAFVLIIGKMMSESLLKGNLFPVLRLLTVFIFFVTLDVTGWKMPLRPSTPPSRWFSPSWSVPPEIEYLTLNEDKILKSKTFARLGPNDDLGLAAFLPREWRLVCRDYAHYGHETKDLVEDIISCLQIKPNYILVSPGFFTLTRLTGTYDHLKTSAAQVLSEYFKCSPIEQRPGSQFCTRVGT